MSKLAVFKNGHDWIIAESADDATAFWNEMTGDNLADYEPDPWEQLPDDLELTMISETWQGKLDWPEAMKLKRPKYRYDVNEGYAHIEATCSDWVQAVGRGLLGSTDC